MVQFAVQRKFTKQTTSSSYSFAPKVGLFFRKIPIKAIWIFFILFTLVYWIFLLLKYTIFSAQYYIKQIDYALNSVQQYDDPYLYKQISSLIKWENYYIISLNNRKIITLLQSNYPFIQDILITYISVNKVFVKIIFYQPQLILHHDTSVFGVYNWSLFQIYSWNTIRSGGVEIDVLSFSSGLDMLTGVFYQYPVENIIRDIQFIRQWFPSIEAIAYLPGGHRMIITLLKGKKVYINNAIDIQQQIKNFQLLKKYYSEFDKLKEIDLWSLEIDKVIVKK